MPCENRKKSFYFEVSKKIVVLTEICVYPDVQCSKRSQQYKWFSDGHLLKLLEKLKDVCLARVLSSNSQSEHDVQDVNDIISGLSSYFHVKYTFKKRGVKQFVVMETSTKNANKPVDDRSTYPGGRHRELYLFPERLKVFVSLAPLKFGTVIEEKISVSKRVAGSEIAKQEGKTGIKEKSKYFGKDKDGALNSSAVKKQASLKSIIQKMKGSCTDVENDVTRNHKQEEISLALASCTVNNTCNSDDQGKDSPRFPSAVNDIEGTRKRSRQDAGLNEDTCTGSDTGTDERHSREYDCDQNDFVTKKSLSRKKRIKHVNKQIMGSNSTGFPKSDRKINPVQTTQDENIHTSTLSEADSNCVVTAKESRSSGTQDTWNMNELNTPGFVDLSKNEQTCFNKKENEHIIVKDKLVERRQYESITIDDTAPSFDNVKKISDLENKHINFLVQNLEKKLKAIFKGKEYCRRHDDYKRGGRSKGDLAFQVRFGLYSEEQQEAIMKELMSIFCSRHNKYIDYLTKVLLPETFIRIYIELFGGNHGEVEHILMGNEKQKETSQTDGSSTE